MLLIEKLVRLHVMMIPPFSYLLQASSLQDLLSQLSPIICTSTPNRRMMVTLLSPHLHIRPRVCWNNQRRHLHSIPLQGPSPSRALRFSPKHYSVFLISKDFFCHVITVFKRLDPKQTHMTNNVNASSHICRYNKLRNCTLLFCL